MRPFLPTAADKVLYATPGVVLELRRAEPVTAACEAVSKERPEMFSLSCSRPVLLAEIPERFSSSSLPPSFAPGRCTTVFTPRGAARHGTPLSFLQGAR